MQGKAVIEAEAVAAAEVDRHTVRSKVSASDG